MIFGFKFSLSRPHQFCNGPTCKGRAVQKIDFLEEIFPNRRRGGGTLVWNSVSNLDCRIWGFYIRVGEKFRYSWNSEFTHLFRTHNDVGGLDFWGKIDRFAISLRSPPKKISNLLPHKANILIPATPLFCRRNLAQFRVFFIHMYIWSFSKPLFAQDSALYLFKIEIEI